jgi:hypothetical protein
MLQGLKYSAPFHLHILRLDHSNIDNDDYSETKKRIYETELGRVKK